VVDEEQLADQRDLDRDEIPANPSREFCNGRGMHQPEFAKSRTRSSNAEDAERQIGEVSPLDQPHESAHHGQRHSDAGAESPQDGYSLHGAPDGTRLSAEPSV